MMPDFVDSGTVCEILLFHWVQHTVDNTKQRSVYIITLFVSSLLKLIFEVIINFSSFKVFMTWLLSFLRKAVYILDKMYIEYVTLIFHNSAMVYCLAICTLDLWEIANGIYSGYCLDSILNRVLQTKCNTIIECRALCFMIIFDFVKRHKKVHYCKLSQEYFF